MPRVSHVTGTDERAARRRPPRAVLTVLFIASGACASAPPGSAGPGSVVVSNTTNGQPEEQRLYTLRLGRQTKVLRAGGVARFDSLRVGTHSIALAHLDENCTLTSLPQTVSVSPGVTTEVEFVVDCVRPVGNILIDNQTGGPIVSFKIRSCGTREWGADLLPSSGDAGTIRAGERRSFEVRRGCRDLQAQHLASYDPGPLITKDTLGIQVPLSGEVEWDVR